MAFDIVGVGVGYTDLLVRVPHPPALGESMPVEDRLLQGGGKVPTALVAAARLGCRVAFIGAVGDDPFGVAIPGELAGHGVDVRGVRVQPGRRSPFSTVLVDAGTGARSILWDGGSLRDYELDGADLAAIGQARYLLICEPLPAALHAARRARQAQVPVAIDADVAWPGIRDALALSDICIVSEGFAQTVAPSPEAALAALPGIIRIVTLGERGLVVAAAGATAAMPATPATSAASPASQSSPAIQGPQRTLRLPAFPVRAVDTTGAGDLFHGAYLAGLCHGLDAIAACRYASAAAAIGCTALGGRTAIPTHPQVLEFLRVHAATRPGGGPGTRPGAGPANWPGGGPGTRPGIGPATGPGAGPGTLTGGGPGTRTDVTGPTT